MNRRLFNSLGFTSLLAPMTGFNISLESKDPKQMKDIFIHHVFVWLKNPESESDLSQLIEGLQGLTKIKSIKSYHLGVPAATKRDVIDATYAVSWLTIFANSADEQAYQIDQIHLDFIKNYKHLWSKIVVYDSIDHE
ncbi:MAG: Dabb family protein [Saprospiraceae bacterium]|nr:Dabb family protein [Saprospiraceae bacterium]